MSFKSFFDTKVQKMDWLDIGLVKWSCIAFGIMIVMLIPAITEVSIWWFVGAFIILAIRPLYRVYLK
jgi:hypothetical protein